ncbi:arginine utilization regulatory protein [Halobacillus karajensis]|uniref:Arginine utilization regulatory protein RocR n=1 Tax=Halobacillus karajensis TaxID=195088 RepID=A0A024P4G9_9BACI|nr:sigma-54-dependent Fis family transcriptional regulator [Halobacillus karajensis]CDQ20765.1 Arginine utilization regulatory protein RocR [Halobacillus karajensis]CDQ23765.1 Arginine utilization regulatory protein RocR [Halobacillus karajensis]CDQ27243.1 Arginine utilization regulatory protein RocR [Halobacillus karajensis]SEI04689.1 arginine utilization regulatory protein [Halobacillus karajensis]
MVNKNAGDIQSLTRMNQLYEKLLNEVDVGIHVINEKGKTIIYNKKMMEIEAMASEDVLDKNLLDVFMFRESQNSTLVKALKTGKTTKNIKQTYFNNKGKEITTINHSFPIKEEGRITGAIEIAKDVTQLERVMKENMLNKQNGKITFDTIIGRSQLMETVVDEAKRATRTSSSVLVVGETGTGKELFAQSIHNGSNRSRAPFISQNCAAIPDGLMESLLFGTKKGAFTGAVDRPGLFEQADGGTLLLDEINSLEPSLQAKLLRVIQDKSIRRVGDTKDKEVDVRIIATINEDPLDAVANNRLRKDLYYRLSVVTLFIPPLRERKEDILLLTQAFIDKYSTLFNMDVKGISEGVKTLLQQHNWPGNVRELEHTIEGTMNLIMGEDVITIQNLPGRFRSRYQAEEEPLVQGDEGDLSESNQTLHEKMTKVEKMYIQRVLKNNGHNITRAAKILGISRQSLQYRLKKFGL